MLSFRTNAQISPCKPRDVINPFPGNWKKLVGKVGIIRVTVRKEMIQGNGDQNLV